MANTDSGREYYSEIAVGIDLLWSNKLDKAEEYFGKLKDSNPRYALHYAEVLVFRSIITEVAADREAAIQRMLTAIKLAEDQLKDLEKGHIPKNRTDINKENLHNHLLDTTVVLADAHTILAALQVVEEQRVKGMLNLRKGWKIYKNTLDSLKTDSTHDDTIVSSLKFGAGLFYFIISLVPPGLPQKVASLAGFSGGDKDLGLKYLRECFASGSIRYGIFQEFSSLTFVDLQKLYFLIHPMGVTHNSFSSYLAGIVLAINNLFLTADLDPSQSNDLVTEAEKIINTGLEKYPEGSFFQSVASLAALERNNVEVAQKHSEVAIKNSEHITTYPALFLRLLSNCFTMKFDWTATGDLLDKLHQRGIELEKKQKSRNPWAFTWNAIRLGACQVMLGNHDKAKKLFNDCANSKTKDRWTQTFLIQSKKFSQTGGWFAMLELMLLTGHYEKVVHNCPLSRKEEILGVLDGIAKNAPGALTKPTGKEEKGLKGWFSKIGRDSLNDPKLDNRVAYLVLQAIVFRSMDRKEDAIKNLQEVISLEGQMPDKMYYALALLEYGRIVAKENPQLALKQFETGIKLNDFVWDSSVRTRIRTCMRQLGSDEPVLPDANSNTATEEDLEALMQAEENEVEK